MPTSDWQWWKGKGEEYKIIDMNAQRILQWVHEFIFKRLLKKIWIEIWGKDSEEEGRNNFEKQQEIYGNVSEAKSPEDSEACEKY